MPAIFTVGKISALTAITKITPDYKTSIWAEPGEPNGHKILAEEPLEPDAAHFKVLVEKVEA